MRPHARAARGGSRAEQIVWNGAAADAVLALDGDSLVLVRRPRAAAQRPVANLGSSPLARWRLDTAPPGGERTVLARGARRGLRIRRHARNGAC